MRKDSSEPSTRSSTTTWGLELMSYFRRVNQLASGRPSQRRLWNQDMFSRRNQSKTLPWRMPDHLMRYWTQALQKFPARPNVDMWCKATPKPIYWIWRRAHPMFIEIQWSLLHSWWPLCIGFQASLTSPKPFIPVILLIENFMQNNPPKDCLGQLGGKSYASRRPATAWLMDPMLGTSILSSTSPRCLVIDSPSSIRACSISIRRRIRVANHESMVWLRWPLMTFSTEVHNGIWRRWRWSGRTTSWENSLGNKVDSLARTSRRWRMVPFYLIRSSTLSPSWSSSRSPENGKDGDFHLARH